MKEDSTFTLMLCYYSKNLRNLIMIEALTQRRQEGNDGRNLGLMSEAGVKVQDPTHAAGGEGLHCCEESRVNKPPERESESETRPNKDSSLLLRLPETQTLQSCWSPHSCIPHPHTHTYTYYSCFTIYRIFTSLTTAS